MNTEFICIFIQRLLYFQLAETVNLHFLSLLEALLECNSMVLSKLLPLWSPVLYSHHIQVILLLIWLHFFCVQLNIIFYQ